MATIICKEQGHLLKVTRQSFLRCLSYNENVMQTLYRNVVNLLPQSRSAVVSEY